MLFHEWHGNKNKSAPVMVVSAGLGGKGAFWTPQFETLSSTFRILSYDQLGTGQSKGDIPEGYSVHDMAVEVLDLLDDQDITQASFMGHAFGGLVGLELARIAPDRIDKLIIAGGWIAPDIQTRKCFELRLSILEHCGASDFLKAQPLFLFPADWLSSHAEELEQNHRQAVEHFPGKTPVIRRIDALRSFDSTPWISSIQHKTLVITARDDLLVPWTASEALAKALPNGEFECLDYGGHACSVTESDAFNQCLTHFL
ncbi:putative aminoacrylate hydrolase RutD [Halomonadaceae bacterium LMG 33818]|uniref:pyrimidine utilization protein D n=1 Tax=Cernens ardua TaxID=3402176 RepID=UPI003EDB8BDA